MDSELVPYIFVGLIVFAILLLIVVIAGRREKLRVFFLDAVANKLGLQSYDKNKSILPKVFFDFALMKQGGSRRIMNIMHGELHGVVTTILDLRYKTSKAQGSREMMQTVILMESKELVLPTFCIHPVETPFEFPENLGFHDIDFSATEPELAKGYIIKGIDSAAVRKVLEHEDILERFTLHRGLALEVQNSHILFYRPDQLRRPEDLGAFMSNGFKILGEFEDALYWEEDQGGEKEKGWKDENVSGEKQGDLAE